jgi:hypothetical protein
MVARYPDLFAAAVPMSGAWPCNTIQDFLGSLHVPVWNFHGANDGTIGVAHSDAAVAALRGAGARVTYTRYQSGGHVIWPTAYSTPGLVDWVMSQRRGVAPSNEPLLAITSPCAQTVLFTGETNLNLSGVAAALGRGVTQVTWTNFANNMKGFASGTNLWSVTDIPLVASKTNLIAVVATTTSWSPAYGGNTTFNDTLTVIQSPIRATLTWEGTEILLRWTGGGPPYRVQRATDLTAADWADDLIDAMSPVPLRPTNHLGFYRITGQ